MLGNLEPVCRVYGAVVVCWCRNVVNSLKVEAGANVCAVGSAGD